MTFKKKAVPSDAGAALDAAVVATPAQVNGTPVEVAVVEGPSAQVQSEPTPAAAAAEPVPAPAPSLESRIATLEMENAALRARLASGPASGGPRIDMLGVQTARAQCFICKGEGCRMCGGRGWNAAR